MKKIFSKTMIFLGIFSLVMGIVTGFETNLTYAQDLELIGKDIGLDISPSETRLFDLSNLNPGDIKEGKVDIKNNYSSPFQLFMRTERISSIPEEGEADLFEQLIISIYLDDIEIYKGPMKDYARSNISLGKFKPDDCKKLRAVVYLPGPETPNEFQGKSVDVKWIFIAKSEEPTEPTEPTKPSKPKPEKPERPGEPGEPEKPEKPEKPEEPEEPEEPKNPDIPEKNNSQPVGILPKTGQMSSTIYYILGTILLGLGIGSRNKK